MTETITGVFEPDTRAIPFADDGDGPALVLIPGGSLGIDYLGTLASVLAEEGFRVLRIGSRRPPAKTATTVTMHDLAQDVIDVMDHRRLEDAWIGGHAFGNRVARTVALDHTDRVNGVLLLAAGGSVQPTGEATAAVGVIFSDADDEQTRAAMPYLVGDPADAERAWVLVKHSRIGALGPMQAAAVAATPEAEWAGLAPGVPVLIVQGTEDKVAPPANGEQLQASASDRASLAWVPGAGHLFAATHPGETAAVIEDYLDWD